MYCFVELFKLAIKYEEDDLKRRCEQQLEVFITRNNVIKLYALAVRHDSKVTSRLYFSPVISLHGVRLAAPLYF